MEEASAALALKLHTSICEMSCGKSRTRVEMSVSLLRSLLCRIGDAMLVLTKDFYVKIESSRDRREHYLGSFTFDVTQPDVLFIRPKRFNFHPNCPTAHRSRPHKLILGRFTPILLCTFQSPRWASTVPGILDNVSKVQFLLCRCCEAQAITERDG